MKLVKYLVCSFICIILFSCTTPKIPKGVTEQEVKAKIDLVESWINDAEVFKAAMYDSVNCVTPSFFNKPYKDWIIPFCNEELPIIQKKHSIDYKFNVYNEYQGPSRIKKYMLTIFIYTNSNQYYEFRFKKHENKWKLCLLREREK